MTDQEIFDAVNILSLEGQAVYYREMKSLYETGALTQQCPDSMTTLLSNAFTNFRAFLATEGRKNKKAARV